MREGLPRGQRPLGRDRGRLPAIDTAAYFNEREVGEGGPQGKSHVADRPHPR